MTASEFEPATAASRDRQPAAGHTAQDRRSADGGNSRQAPPAPDEIAGRDPQAVARFVEEFGAVLSEAGLPRMPSRVLACLMASERGELTAAALAERLQISPAAVSGAIKYLIQVRLVTRGRQPDSRRDLYRVQQNVWYESLLDRNQMLRHWGQILDTGINAVGPDSEAGDRLSESAEFLEFLRNELDGMVERWNAHLANRSRRS